jgi:hypothetical protein
VGVVHYISTLLITLWNKDRTDFEVVLGGGKLGILGFGLGEKLLTGMLSRPIKYIEKFGPQAWIFRA